MRALLAAVVALGALRPDFTLPDQDGQPFLLTDDKIVVWWCAGGCGREVGVGRVLGEERGSSGVGW